MDYQNTRYCDKCFSQLQPEDVSCPVCGWDPSQPEPASSTLPTGTILLGKYAVGRVLGKGGFGVTYLAFDLLRAERVAIKEYMPDTLSYRMPGTTLISTYFGEKEQNFHLGAEKFYEEAHTLSRFSGNPNITRVQEFFYENNTAYFVMEYIQGSDLKAFIAQNGGRLSEHAVLALLWPLLGALEAVHAQGILHRDISPDNVFLTDGGVVKLLDFGSARQVLGEQSKSLSVVLKPGFAPVEQYQTHGRQGEWTDVYALAATAYYCLTGKVPESAMDRVVDDSLEPPSALGAEISPDFEEVLLQAMSVRATGRIQNIPELRAALLRAVPDAAPQAEPASEESAESSGEEIPAEESAEPELSAEPQGGADASSGAFTAFLRFCGTARECFAEFWASSALHKTEVCGAAAVVLAGIIAAVVFTSHSPIHSVPAAAMSSKTATMVGGGGTAAASAVSQSSSVVSSDAGSSSAVSSASATASSTASSSQTVVQQNHPSSKSGDQITVTPSPSPNDKPSSASSPDPIYSQPQEASSAPPPAKNEYNYEFPDYLPDDIDIGITHAEYSSTGMEVKLLMYNNTDSPKIIQVARITLCKDLTKNGQPIDIIMDRWLPSNATFTVPAHGSARQTCDMSADDVKVWGADLRNIATSVGYYKN